jgi:tRNA modification GTPase
MQTPDNETISAIITPVGTGGIAVIRLSGPASIPIANNIFRGTVNISKAPSHTVHFGTIADEAGDEIDEVLVTVFRAPHSYTAEDVVEISCHGSSYIAGRILDLVVSKGSRPAGPGEFTKRAFLNGRIDLSQAEAVADLVSADSRPSHDLALAQLRGKLSGKISELRNTVLNLCSTLELELDFTEEGLEFIKRDELRDDLVAVKRTISHLIDSYGLGKIYKEGVRIVLAGSPNAGKSSILNALIKEERAIVTPVSGTTRDTIEESVIIAGMKFTIVDTAGIRNTQDIVEVEGIRRTEQQVQFSDLILFVLDPTQDVQSQGNILIGNPSMMKDSLNRIVILINKADLIGPDEVRKVQEVLPKLHSIVVSAKTGMGISELERFLSGKFNEPPRKSSGETIVLSNLRQKESLTRVLECIDIVLEGVETSVTPDFLAVDLRVGLTHLSQVVGVDISEDILNNIFSRFCIGK